MPVQTAPFLSVIFPAYNEAEKIYANILQVCDTLQAYDFELIVVDDGSQDRTYLEAKRAEVKGLPVYVFSQEKNRGKGSALFYGVEQASGEYIAFLDADLEISPSYLVDMLNLIAESGADAVAGVKDMDDNQFPWARRVMSVAYRRSVSFLFGLDISDTQTGIKLFKSEVLQAVAPRLRVSRFAFDIELLLAVSRFGYQIVEYPVKISYHRTGSFGRMNLRNILGAFWDTVLIYSRASFWTWLEPSRSMRVWMALFAAGIFLFGVGVGKLLTPVILHGAVKKVFRVIALQFLPTAFRDWLLLIGGFFLILLSAIQLNKKFLEAFVRRDSGDDLAGIFRNKKSS